MGVARLGYGVFFISPRNSAAAVTHLLSKTGAVHVLVGPEKSSGDLAEAALKSLQESSLTPPTCSTMPSFETLYPTEPESEFIFLPPVQFNMDSPAMLTHTSGSTAFPKPLMFTQYRLLVLCLAPFFGVMDKTGLRLSTHSIPMFHGMGMSVIAWAASSGLTITNFKPRSPATSIAAESVIQSASATNSDIVFCVPMFVEEWARNPEDLERLRKMKGILFGGGPMSQQVGNFLTDSGVPVYNTYGIGECGIMSPLFPKHSARDWDAFEFTANIKPHFVYDEETGYFQVFILPNPYHVPNVLNATIDGGPAYNTNDWLKPHPTIPGYWQIVDRVDNQIIHSTGEKTNPGPLETILVHDWHVKAAVMFGRGKFNAGIIVDPHPQYAFDPVDTEKLATFRNAIWPSVEKMNDFAPQHSRIFKEMILVSSPNKPFEYTAKFSARRQAIIAAYDPEIEALYATVDETTQPDLSAPSSWEMGETLEFVRTIVNKVLKTSAADGDDIFHQGCDSLQATWIRNSLIHALKETSKADVRTISSGFVYQHPTIDKLAEVVFNIAISAYPPAVTTKESKVHAMQDLVKKYTTNFSEHFSQGDAVTPSQDTILLTGSTGGLGASLLAKLVECPQVARIYAVNRESQDTATLSDRQKLVLQERGYGPDIVDSPKLILLEADISVASFGIPKETYDEICKSVTHIIHNAYRVDWNISLSSFEPSVRAVRNLVDLALSSPLLSPPRVIFMSSIAVVRSERSADPIKEDFMSPESAVENGYSESKWVCERLLQAAATETSLRPVVVRAGQVAGSPSGAWNTSEWLPSLVKSSVHLNALPSTDKEVSWIPADAAAQAIIDARNASGPVLHLVHPQSVPASTVLSVFSETLSLPLIPFAEWVERLQKSSQDCGSGNQEEILNKNPALKLLGFFVDGVSATNVEAFGAIRMDTSQAVAEVESLQEERLAQLSADDARGWLSYWKSIGFLDDNVTGGSG
ncbi:hypothetical protein EUX98_g1995 [Antrodiella citrinella]|uniref:Polyketide synthase phosphopantetheine-binding domain-containing protein n=1 Tax=Antrodiella citrinella TaxID=2447956 RepID=A0A4S4N048_9APHY|nr:hypothetical protein EUX98_g1995 [Antrodiella citrinella]